MAGSDISEDGSTRPEPTKRWIQLLLLMLVTKIADLTCEQRGIGRKA